MTDREQLLRRAVTISLFSWRRANDDDDLDDSDRQGWWGDSVPTVPGDQIGSRLWLLRRRSLVPDTFKDAKDYADEALAWMVADGIVASVTVTVERYGINGMRMSVLTVEANGEALELAFEDTWSLINAV